MLVAILFLTTIVLAISVLILLSMVKGLKKGMDRLYKKKRLRDIAGSK